MNALAKKYEFDTAVALPEIDFNKPAISVVGLGYVGAVSTACLSQLGHRVVGVDVDTIKVDQIAEGTSPIHEKDLGVYLDEGVSNNLITATTDLVGAVIDTSVTFLSVGTPTSEDGGCDYRYIEAAARSIGEGLRQKNSYHVIVMRCSIPPGATLNVMVPEIEKVSGLKMGDDFGICFNPEFLREGTAIEDFYAPPKTVVGANDERAAKVVADIYAPVDDNVIMTTIDVAEMVKYVDNVWHAAKVSFANEIGRICKPLKIDSHKVMDIFFLDTKLNISKAYLLPGFAFGGSCLPKDVRAIRASAKAKNLNTPIFDSLLAANDEQVKRAFDMIQASGKKKVGLMGLSFKAHTDDLRESPLVTLSDMLIENGYELKIYDPCVSEARQMDGANKAYIENGIPQISACLVDAAQEVTDHADIFVIGNGTEEFYTILDNVNDNAQILDLVRLNDSLNQKSGYTGICW